MSDRFGSDRGPFITACNRSVPSVGPGWSMAPCLMCHVGFFGLGRFFLALGRVFSSLVGVYVKNHGPYLIQKLLRVKNYVSYPPVVLIGSDRIFSVGAGRLGRIG